MIHRSILTACLAVFLTMPLVAGEQKPQDKPPDKPKEGPQGDRLKWRALFNGTDLKGWSVEGKGQWTVEDGTIVGRQEQTAHGESWLMSDEEFSDFVLLLKFQITKGGNSGVFFRVPRLQGHPADLAFEMQIWDADPQYPTGSIFAIAKGTPGLHSEAWNEVQIACAGRAIFTAVNGRVAVAVNNKRRMAGRLGFQVHGGSQYKDTVVRFKDIRIAPITDAPEPPPKPEPGKLSFKKIKLDGGMNEGAAVFDVNRDGTLDIVCGQSWYEGPDWKPHPVREVVTDDQRAESFYELPFDANGDGLIDLIAGGGMAKKEFWYENPRSATKSWPPHEWLTRRAFIEDMVLIDLEGDGKMNDLLPNGNGSIQWIEIVPGASPKFVVHEIGKQGMGHGIGYGDVNGDGRTDIITPQGWWEAPVGGKGQWTWHGDFKLKGSPGVPIRTLDVNGDGKPEIVYGNGHGYGLFWLEPGVEGGKPKWTEHVIDDSFGQAHYIELADVNGDGRTDIVTGKRWRAHGSGDESGCEPTCLFWFEHDGKGAKWTRHTIDYNGAAGCGMGLQAVDIDGDGDIDIVAPGKGGLYLFLNQKAGR